MYLPRKDIFSQDFITPTQSNSIDCGFSLLNSCFVFQEKKLNRLALDINSLSTITVKDLEEQPISQSVILRTQSTFMYSTLSTISSHRQQDCYPLSPLNRLNEQVSQKTASFNSTVNCDNSLDVLLVQSPKDTQDSSLLRNLSL